LARKATKPVRGAGQDDYHRAQPTRHDRAPAIGPEPLDADGQFDETGNADPDASLGVRLGYRVSYDPNTDSLEHVVFFPLHGNPATAQYATCLPLGMYRLRRSLCLRRDRHFVPKQTVVNQIPPQLRWYIDLE
jgi:hypothetical protein